MASEVRPIRPALIEILRATLRHLEESEELRPDDPALIEVKSHILQSIAELESRRTAAAA